MNKINYQRELDKLLDTVNNGQKLLLHACCAPCSSYCLEYLSRYFSIYVYFYNPNITEYSEYNVRKEEIIRFIDSYDFQNEVQYIDGEYDTARFFDMAKGLEECREGGERCHKCYELRIRAAAKKAAELNCDYFCTTLTISPLKNSQVINQIGYKIETEYKIDSGMGVKWLPSDFKKKNGFKRSIELSEEYGLYRQNYCGCVFSKKNNSQSS